MTDRHSSTAQPAAIAVATWWADKAGIVTGNGDLSDAGGFTTALAVLAGAQGRAIAPSKRQAFIDALARRVSASLERQDARDSDYAPSVTIGVDYGPDAMLADAASEAGVPTGAFPWKTMTWTYADHVVASLGYGGRSLIAWQSEHWERPACGLGQHDERPPYERRPWRCSAPVHHEGDHIFDEPEPLCVASVEKRGEVRACNRPANDADHQIEDSYYGQFSWSHEFKAGA